jgi:predicted phage terminase large subunit-like protein
MASTMDLDAYRFGYGVDEDAFRPSSARFCRSIGEAARLRGVVTSETLLAWAARMLPLHFTLPPSAMHRWLAGELDAMRLRRGTKLNVVGPRASAKSTVATLAYVVRVAVEASEPYVWIVSDTRHQACGHLENIKCELIDNELLVRQYPDATGIGPVWRGGTVVLPNRVMIEAFGTGQKLRGRRRRSHRPSLIVCDDIQNDAHAHSKLRRERCREWFYGALMQAGTAATNVVHLATALHREALALELDGTPGWASRRFAAIERWPDDAALWDAWRRIYGDADRSDAREMAKRFYEANRDAMDAGAKLLWPEAEDLYSLKCLEAEVGRTAFEREKQSSPVNPAACEFPEEYFQDGLWFDVWPAAVRVKAIALDPSKGKSDAVGDYSAFVLLAIDTSGVLHVQADMDRRPTPRIVSDAVTLVAEFRPDGLGVEANQFQDLLVDELQAEFARRELSHPPLWLISNSRDKRLRVRTLGPFLSQRRLRFKSGCPSTRLLVEQLRDFPAGDHDDGPDALEMAIRMASAMEQGLHHRDPLGDRIRLSV